MKKLSLRIAFTALLFSGQALAMPGNLVAGNQLSTGAVTLEESTPSLAHNPALLGRALGGDKIQINGFKLPAFAIELGDIDEDFAERLDELDAAIECAEDDSDQSEAGFVRRQGCAADAEGKLNVLMDEFVDAAKVNFEFAMPVPALPVVFRAFDGVMAVNVEAAANIGMRVLHSNTTATLNQNGTPLNPNDDYFDVQDDTAAYVKSALFTQLGVGYSRKAMDLPAANFGDGAELFLGGRAQLIQGKLSRQIVVVDDDEDANGETAFDRAEDNYDLNEVTSTSFGLDLGVGVTGGHYSLGFQIRNLIAPEFDFGTLGRNCERFEGSQRTDCERSADYTEGGGRYSGELIAADEDYKLDPQLVIEGSYDIADSNFVAIGSFELNDAKNINGNKYQWLHLGVGYNGPWWIPTARLGYRANVASGGVDVLTLGVNLFNFLAIEAFQATDSAKFDGDKYPRSAGVSVGFTGYF